MIQLLIVNNPTIVRLSRWFGQTLAGAGILALIWTVGDPFGQENSLD